MTAGVLTFYYTGSLQFYGGVNLIILSTVRQSDNHFTIITPLLSLGDIKPYRNIKLSMIYYRFISLFKFFKSFMSFANHKHQNYYLYLYQIKISKYKSHLALLYKHVINHHLLYFCQHLILTNIGFFNGFSSKVKQICYLFGLTT